MNRLGFLRTLLAPLLAPFLPQYNPVIPVGSPLRSSDGLAYYSIAPDEVYWIDISGIPR